MATALRAPRAKALSVAVLSGKGGVGKTNLAVNLAICLAGRGNRVTLLDADLGLANADLLLDVTSPYNLSQVISGTRRIEEVGQVAAGGIFFVPGVSGLDRVADLSRAQLADLVSQFRSLGNRTDLAIVDCGAGMSRSVLGFALAADISIVITTPEPMAMADSYAVVKALAGRGYPAGAVRVVVNQAESRAEARRVFERLSGVAKRFIEFPIADGGYLLQDTHVELAVRQRCPFVLRYPRCAASACVSAIAGRVADRRGLSRRTGSFFRRVVGLFV